MMQIELLFLQNTDGAILSFFKFEELKHMLLDNSTDNDLPSPVSQSELSLVICCQPLQTIMVINLSFLTFIF